MTTIERLRTEFMELPRNERVALFRDLQASLDIDESSENSAESLDPEFAAGLADTARERARQLDAGEATARDWHESLQMARAEVAARSAARNAST